MAYPCQDCGKVLATQGGLDVHRAQWCAGVKGDGVPAERPGRFGRRDRRRQERAARRERAAPVPPRTAKTAAPAPKLVPLTGGRSQPASDGATSSPVAGGPAMPAAVAGNGAAPPPVADTSIEEEQDQHEEEQEESIDLLAPAIDLRDTDERIELSMIMWLMRRRAHQERLPKSRTVVRFNFTGSRTESYWLVLESPDVHLLSNAPREAADVIVHADTTVFKRVFQGRMLLADALHDDLIRLEGPEALVQSLPRWFDWSTPLTPAGG